MPRKGWRKQKEPCSIEGCERLVKARGWCDVHYACWRTTGDPIPRKIPHYGQNKPRISAQGYRLIYEPNHPLAMSHGYVLEHRKVAWDAGLLTDKSLVVHHKNHDKLDNRLGNLEVKTSSAHSTEHVKEEGEIVNQFGTFPLQGEFCSIDDCSKPVKSRTWCSAHYTRYLRSGDPLGHSRGSRRRSARRLT